MATPVNKVNTKVVQLNEITTTVNTAASEGGATSGVGSLPLVVVVGPTASGKSATAMRIAKEFNGEIICADSRTVYRGLDIGTAKPTAADQAEVPHWGLDIATPGDVFTAADFKSYALNAVADIRARGKLPILVGGTGLYVDGIIFDYKFQKTDPKLRQELEQLSLHELINYCANNNVSLPENDKNRRHVMRAIELKSTSGTRLESPIDNTIIVGITTDRGILRSRIADRARQLFADGMLEEALVAGEKYGWGSEAMTGNIYKLAHQYVQGGLAKDQLLDKFITSDWRLAKRQLTWLKRNPHINWRPLDEAYEFVKGQLTS